MSDQTSSSDLFIVDDEASMRDALSVVFTLAGYRVSLFAEAEPFLAAARDSAPAAVLLDLHLPDQSGLEVLRKLDAPHFPAPVLVIVGAGEIASAVEAVRSGAFDCVVEPFDGQALVARVGRAIAGFGQRQVQDEARDFPGHALLTPREREVLSQIAGGASNKEAGRHLGISPRTVEVHRARIMEKIGARNAADLVRIVLGGSRSHARHAQNTSPPGMFA